MSLGQANNKYERICRPMEPKLMLNYSAEVLDIVCACKPACGAKCPCYLPESGRTVQQCRPSFCRECGCTVDMLCIDTLECDAYTFFINR